MKNLKYFIALFIISFSFALHSQTTKITYKAELHNKKNKDHPMVISHKREVSLMTFSLIFDEENSYFIKNFNNPINSRDARLAEILIGYYSEWYQEKENSVIYWAIRLEDYQVEYPDRMKGWKLVQGEKEIAGFVCKKAINKKFNKRTGNYYTYTAWYTQDISSPFGPVGIGGLPGVILELKKGKGYTFTAQKVEFDMKSKSKVPKINPAKRISNTEKIRLSKIARGQ